MLAVPKPATTPDLQSHLWMLHGIYTEDVRTKRGKEALPACHAEDHEAPWSPWSVPHVHR